ncbi:MAG: sugar-binding transcriptional regulator [Silicimonas sp.]|nr:sugar-binding transcriptional regulator [Silicimonas sp.]
MADDKLDAQKELRIRAAWIYHVEGRTQSEVADILGINRVAVTRLLADAKKKSEVIVTVSSDLAPLAELERQLEARFGLNRCIVVPHTQTEIEPVQPIAHAAAAYINELVVPGMTIGVGWGRTLHAMLRFIEARPVADLRVVSLLGGLSEARRFNPAEFAWQFAEKFGADGFLLPAPAVVDSVETRDALIERCGIHQVFDMADESDVVLLSCGALSQLNTSYRVGIIDDQQRDALADLGAVGDMLFTFLGEDGRPADHDLNERCISFDLERIRKIRKRVLISGGPAKLPILRASLKAVQPTTLITDEHTARGLNLSQ